MPNNLPENIDYLLDEKIVECFLNDHAKEIFKKDCQIVLERIERSKSFAPEVFNMIYDVKVDGEPIILRASASTKRERETTYKVMEYLYNNGFKDGYFLVPEPCCFFPDKNLMFYIDVPGLMLKDFIKDDKNSLSEKIHGAGQALRQLHRVPQPDFMLPRMEWDIREDKIVEYAPGLKEFFGESLSKKIDLTTQSSDSFCHGDYQPKNIVLGEKLCVIDFGSSTLANRELDVACFLTQLESMLERYGNIDDFEFLKESFIWGYGDFRHDLYMAYDYLFRLQIMQALIVIYENDPNANKEAVKKSIDFWGEQMKAKHELREA